MPLLEKYGFYALVLGAILVLAGYIWLVVRAFKFRRLWGVGALIPPLGLLFPCRHFKQARGPALLLLLGGSIIGGTYGLNYYASHYMDLGPREKIVDGEMHITLTGWDGTDYGILKMKPEVVVLQMANPDVTDQTLENLKDLSKLRELDLNDTLVTDSGLIVLKEIPSLQILRLRKTKLTDQGFRDHLADKESLLELDVRETQVASKSLRDWKAKKKDDRKYLR